MNSSYPWTDPPFDLPEGTSLELIGDVPAPPHDVGLGDAGHAGSIDLARLPPTFSRVPIEAGLDVQRWGRDPSVFRVTAQSVEVVSGAFHMFSAGDVAIDARSQPALLRAATASGSVALHLGPDRVRAWRVPESAALAPFLNAPTVGEPSLAPLPPLTTLLDGLSAPAWMAEEYARRMEGSPSDRLAAAGLVARLWAPETKADRDGARTWLIEGRGTVAARVADWLERASTPPSIRLVADDLIPTVWMIRDQLLVLSDDGALTEDVRVGLAGDVATDRDDLESVIACAQLVGTRDAALGSALKDLDDTAASLLEPLAELLRHGSRGPRWRAVRRSSPEAWWAIGKG